MGLFKRKEPNTNGLSELFASLPEASEKELVCVYQETQKIQTAIRSELLIRAAGHTIAEQAAEYTQRGNQP